MCTCLCVCVSVRTQVEHLLYEVPIHYCSEEFKQYVGSLKPLDQCDEVTGKLRHK